MGNSPPTGGLRVANSDYSSVVKIAPSVAIEFTGRKVWQRGGYEGKSTESWEVEYNLGTKKCCLILEKSSKNSMSSPTRLDEELEISIWDEGLRRFTLPLKRGEDGGLFQPRDLPLKAPPRHLRNRTVDANGEITETHFYFYGDENKRNLVVREDKWRIKDKNPYTVTVTHYYVNTEDGKDVGLSMAVKKIRVLPNGNFDFAVEGPEEHPAIALHYMLDEVSRTNTWNPTYCHHCADKIIPRQRPGISQTDNENSNIQKVPATLVHGPRKNTGSLLVNDGSFSGGFKNGSLIIEKFFFRRR